MGKLSFSEFKSVINSNVSLKEVTHIINHNTIDMMVTNVVKDGRDDLYTITIDKNKLPKPDAIFINMIFSYEGYNIMSECDETTLTDIINTAVSEVTFKIKETFPIEEQVISNYFYAVKMGLDKLVIPQKDDDKRAVITSDCVSIYNKTVNELLVLPFSITGVTSPKDINNYLVKNGIRVTDDLTWAKGYFNGCIEYLKDNTISRIGISKHNRVISVYERRLVHLQEIQDHTNKLF